MPGIVLNNGIPLHTMNGLDIEVCLAHAQQIDPTRGPAWFAAFLEKAEKLGYRESPLMDCPCEPDEPCRPDCRMVRAHVGERVWPHEDSGKDGLLLVDRLPSPANPYAVAPDPEAPVRSRIGGGTGGKSRKAVAAGAIGEELPVPSGPEWEGPGDMPLSDPDRDGGRVLNPFPDAVAVN